MSKAEELRGSLEEAIRCYDVFGDHKISLAMSDMIIGLIAAARQEGAEAERAWLKQYADKMGGAMKDLVGRLLEVPKEQS